jgi:hypothetical protein
VNKNQYVYHFYAKMINRKQGNIFSKVASNSGSVLTDAENMVHDFSIKKAEVVHTELFFPNDSWQCEQLKLWQKIVAAEHRIDSQYAREIEVALPPNLSVVQQQALLTDFVKIFTEDGMIVDLSIHHEPVKQYALILLTTRDLTAKGFGYKNAEWKQKEKLKYWRKTWAVCLDNALQSVITPEQVSEKSYQKQRGDRTVYTRVVNG